MRMRIQYSLTPPLLLTTYKLYTAFMQMYWILSRNGKSEWYLEIFCTCFLETFLLSAFNLIFCLWHWWNIFAWPTLYCSFYTYLHFKIELLSSMSCPKNVIHLFQLYCEDQARVRQGSARDGPEGKRPQSLKPCLELTLKLVATTTTTHPQV